MYLISTSLFLDIFTKFVSHRRHESILFLQKRTQKLAPLSLPNKQLIRRRLRGYAVALMKSFLRMRMIKAVNESDAAAPSQTPEKDSRGGTHESLAVYI